MGAVAVGASLFALLLVVVAAMVWQEARSSVRGTEPVYLLDEASRFVLDRLPEEQASRLGPDDVKTILEWGLYHTQVVTGREDDGPAVVGGGEALAFVIDRATTAGGDPYRPVDVAAVLDLETGYLAEIGAVGDRVGEEAR